jgi:mannan endo-1,4-beta-mannosidase
MKVKFLKSLFHIAFLILLFSSCTAQNRSFVKVENGQFTINNTPYYFMGTNFWYGPILGSKGKEGDRSRLIKELDFMKSNGIVNLRILVGAEGPEDNKYRVKPSLQPKPGEYNQKLLDGLDFLMAEMGKRDMRAVLFLNNSWDWSGGIGQYLEWNGFGESPCIPEADFNWNAFQAFNGRFYGCKPCVEQYYNHVRFILSRTNVYNGLKYTEDPTIMTWEIANEPRPFGKEFIPDFENYIQNTASLIKSIDKNHMVTTGTEGIVGSQDSVEFYEKLHSNPNIDYLTFHIWPKNWRWLDIKNIPSTINLAIEKTNDYIDKHIAIAKKLNKPIVAEEFGIPRDKHGYSPNESTICRDSYFENIFKKISEASKNKGVLAGCNFWTYSGFGRPSKRNDIWFKSGDNYLGDPPCEEQGLNSVFDTDSTIVLVKKYAKIFSGKQNH